MIELSVISFREYLVLPVRIELTTSPLPRECSTTELRQRRAGCELRRDAAANAAILAIRATAAQAAVGTRQASYRVLPWAFLPAAPPLILPAMDDRPKRTQKASQQRRLGAALRENLKRRKAQAKGRASAPGTDPKDDLKADDKSHDSAGIAGHKQRS